MIRKLISFSKQKMGALPSIWIFFLSFIVILIRISFQSEFQMEIAKKTFASEMCHLCDWNLQNGDPLKDTLQTILKTSKKVYIK